MIRLCHTTGCVLRRIAALALEAAFDGGRITSDGGLLWLAEADDELGLCEAISESVPEWRKRRGRHALASLVRQRVFQMRAATRTRTTPTPCAMTRC